MSVPDSLPQGPAGRRWRVLVVDDSAATRELVVASLQEHGFEVTQASTGNQGVRAAEQVDPDVVLLDVHLPDRPSVPIIGEMRTVCAAPILLLTGDAHEEARVRGLDLGADDYIVKPFSVRELAARVRAAVRRNLPAEPPAAIAFGAIEIDIQAREARRASALVDLTAKEFDLIVALATRPRVTVSRDALLRLVWGTRAGWQGEATVTEHVRRIRQKLEEDPTRPRHIVTVRGGGYRFDP